MGHPCTEPRKEDKGSQLLLAVYADLASVDDYAQIEHEAFKKELLDLVLVQRRTEGSGLMIRTLCQFHHHDEHDVCESRERRSMGWAAQVLYI